MSTHKNTRLLSIELGTLSLLLIPFVAMFYTTEVNWTAADFLVAAVLLLVLGLFVELVLRNVRHFKSKAILITLIIIVFLLLWIELAVGIF